jgi:hypothetical protein
VRAGSDGSLIIGADLPAGYHLNPMAPQRYRISVEKGEPEFGLISGAAGRVRELRETTKSLKLPLRIPLSASAPGAAELKSQLTLFYCREDNTGTCRIKTLVWHAPVSFVKDPAAPTELRISSKLTAE